MSGAYGLLALALAMVTVMRVAVSVAAPQIALPGDRLVFSAALPPILGNMVVPARLVAGPWARPGPMCQLDLRIMAAGPGALTVLAVRPDGVMLSWAGGATSPRQDCRAASADAASPLLVTDVDYMALTQSEKPRRY